MFVGFVVGGGRLGEPPTANEVPWRPRAAVSEASFTVRFTERVLSSQSYPTLFPVEGQKWPEGFPMLLKASQRFLLKASQRFSRLPNASQGFPTDAPTSAQVGPELHSFLT